MDQKLLTKIKVIFIKKEKCLSPLNQKKNDMLKNKIKIMEYEATNKKDQL